MELIPEELRRAHEDGQVVFFCGAGVSMPAGLPSFKGLVRNVLKDLLPPKEMCVPGSTDALAWLAFEQDRYDDALDILESPRGSGHEPKNVRERVRHHLTRRRIKALDPHLTLARLADLDTESGRLITTNFDHLFEKAQTKLRRQQKSLKKLQVYVAPALPPAKPNTLRGLIYLHGKLNHSQENSGLVLTTANFGTAYLLEGWARRFVVDLFRRYHIMFIGYRVEDPTMRYLVSALAAEREESAYFKEAYALAPYDANSGNPITKDDAEHEWKIKGLTPLAYDSADNHSILWSELEEWSNDHRQGILGRRQKVVQLGQFPPANDQDPKIKELAWALKDRDVSAYFADQPAGQIPNPGWIFPLQNAGLLNLPIGYSQSGEPIAGPLVSRQLIDNLGLDDTTANLGRWIAKSLDKQEALDWALRMGGVLHWSLRREIQTQLSNSRIVVPAGARKIWRLLADDEYAHTLSTMLFRSHVSYRRINENPNFVMRNLLNRLRPIPVFSVMPDYIRQHHQYDPSDPRAWCEIKIELVGIENEYDIRHIRERLDDWENSLAQFADEITSRLVEAMDWFREFDQASDDEDSTHVRFRSVSDHDQNKYAPTWIELIKLSRDAYDAIVAVGNHEKADHLVRRWHSIPYPIFRRLALYAATGGRDA